MGVGAFAAKRLLLPASESSYNERLYGLHFLEEPEPKPKRRVRGSCNIGSCVTESMDESAPVPILIFKSDAGDVGGYTGTDRFDSDVGKGHPHSWLVYFHGNSCDLGDMQMELRLMSSYCNINIMAVEYPGYGLTQRAGIEPSPSLIDATVRRVHKMLVEQHVPGDQLYIMGRSIGTGPATYLANLFMKHSNLGGLILHQPYLSIHRLVDDYVSWASGVISNHWDTHMVLSRNRNTNLLLIHGKNDEVIGHYHSKELYASFQPSHGFIKVLRQPKNMPHNEYYIIDQLGLYLDAFFRRTQTGTKTRVWHPVLRSNFCPQVYLTPESFFNRSLCGFSAHVSDEEGFSEDEIGAHIEGKTATFAPLQDFLSKRRLPTTPDD